jgi:hypothetical protein
LFWAKIGAAREVALAKVETVDYRFSGARGLIVATRSDETAAWMRVDRLAALHSRGTFRPRGASCEVRQTGMATIDWKAILSWFRRARCAFRLDIQ